MYAKSFMALDGYGRLTGARTVQAAPYDHYTCHLCGSALQYHPQYDSERPWFEHTDDALTENGRQHCPYVVTTPDEQHLIQRLRRLVSDAHPAVCHADWHCSGCDGDYHGERYCLTCSTGEYSDARPDANRTAEVMACAC
ncbi:putative zinc ribbon protein [Enterobacter ludwigii]|uniref:putative zinc ribbon protein n=1 Tax=Enterobacter ludwigii TaxID=299767 RepID=UPI002430C3D9|nr:putative zinc ribbon protein [Enterobacter ludwigii]WGA04001.1 zinc-ribbon domain-containing protein [Enterobacter ludwigii]